MSLFTKKASFDSSKCVSLLELTLQRIKILRSKKLIIAKQSRDDVAKLLQKGQDANAAARVEHVFREQNIAGAYDLLEQYCQLIIKRISIIKSGKECPPELKEAIASLIYSAPRCGDLQELQKLRDLLTSKCGDEYSSAALEQRPEGSVNQQIIHKLSGRLPNSDTRLSLLKEIASEYKIDWNYQKAAASFKNGEASMQDKQKVKSLNQVLKHADVDKEKPPASAPNLLREEQVSTAAHNVIPSQSVNTRSETGEATDVARQPPITDKLKTPYSSLHGDGGYKSHVSGAAAQNTRGSTTHSSTPKPTEIVGASKKPIVGSPTTFEKERPHDVPKHQVSSRDKESLQASRPLPRQKDYMGANPISGSGLHADPTKEKVSLINAPEDELKGQQRLVNPTRNLNSRYEEKDFESPSRMRVPKASSVDRLQDALVERDHSDVPHSTSLRPKSSVNSTQALDGRIQESTERTELNRLKEHAASTGGFHHAQVLSSKLLPHSISDHRETNNVAESLAARQYMKAHKSYLKADASGGEKDLKHMENPGTNVIAKHGTELSHVDPYVRLRQEGRMDYKSGQGAAQERPTSQSIDKEEDVSPHEYYGREQPKATHYYAGEQHKGTRSKRGSNGLSHEDASSHMSEERIWKGMNDYNSQARRPAAEIHHRNPSTLPELVKRHDASPLAPSKRDKELANLEASAETACVSAAHAADAARVAIDMVRLNSMRSKKTGLIEEREPYVKTTSDSIVTETHAEMQGVDSDVENGQDKQENNSHYREAYQEEEPFFYDSKMPHFDDYNSDESSEEEARFYTKRRAATARKDDAQENKRGAANQHNQSMSPFVKDTLGSERTHLSVKKNLEHDFSTSLDSDDCAESGDFLSSKSSFSSLNFSAQTDVQHSYRPQVDRYEQSDSAVGWTSAAPKRSHANGRLNTSNPSGAAMATDYGGRQGRFSATNEPVTKYSAIRWGASVPERENTDFSKQRWNLTAANTVDTQQPTTAHNRDSVRDHPAGDAQAAHVGKYGGVSRRSVRSTRLP